MFHHVPISDIKDRIEWQFTSHGELFVKSPTWLNNINVLPHPNAR